MSTDRQPHPLDGALEEYEGEAATYEVPVDGVRARVRRRRRARAAARGGVVLVTLGAVAVLAPQAVEGPAVPVAAPAGDWPPQFVRCGLRPDDVRVDDGPADTWLGTTDPAAAAVAAVDPGADVGSDRSWRFTSVVSVAPDVATEGRLVATDVSLVRGGEVVAVQSDARVPQAGGAPTEVSPFPLVVDLGVELVSCGSYPIGEGDPVVPAGVYDAVVTHTVEWVDPAGAVRTARTSATTTLDVADDGASVPAPEACGADAAMLVPRSGPTGNPFPVTLDADVPVRVAADQPLRLTVTATNEGTATVAGSTGDPTVLLTRGGRVVSVPVRTDDARDATLAPGASITWEKTVEPRQCGDGIDEPLPVGRYEVWVAVDLLLAEPEGTDGPDRGRPEVHLLYGPWPVSLG
ncbi:hypothetical protein [Cellulomonas wangsupingiae]|uniref:hypothetical protein n=1 Tax=Cellulomonas wangsupingiae TaxID=2968085 RepID=UPI001D0EAA8B|nr:hypothetical protein [Cellulomonas wangsupingiae]MCM0639940.1 hypothetical protein [Cellulomonas wangsupingiae]